MTKLTKEQVKFFIETMTDDMHNTTQHEIAETLLSKFDECESLQAKLLAYEQAAKNPVAWSHTKLSKGCGMTTPLYTAPVLPKQPELVENLKRVMNSWLAMEPKLAFQPEFTDVMMLLDAEAPPAQPVIPEEKSAIHRTKEPEDIAFNNGFAAGWNCCRSEVISLNETTAQPVIPEHREYISFDTLMAAVSEVTGVKREFDATPDKCHQIVPFMNFNSLSRIVEMFRKAQPVSEPYKLPSGWKLVPIEPTAAMFHAFNDCDYGRKSMRERYIQMIEAAPARECENG